MHVDGALERRGLAVVDGLGQVVAGEAAAGGAHQDLEDVELKGGQFHAPAVDRNFARAGVQADAVHFEADALVGLRFGAAQNGANAGRQFPRVERLGQVIVGA